MAFYIDTCLTELHCILSVSRRGATVSIIINSGFLWLFIYAKENEMPQIYLQSTLVFFSCLFSAEQAAVAGGEGAFPGLHERRDADCRRWGFLQRCAQLLWGKTLWCSFLFQIDFQILWPLGCDKCLQLEFWWGTNFTTIKNTFYKHYKMFLKL